MKKFYFTAAILMLVAAFTLRVNSAGATMINFELNSLEGTYTLTEGFWPPYERKYQNILLAEELINITEYTRELRGYFTLPQYEGFGQVVPGYLTGRFLIQDPAWSGDRFNYGHVFGLKSTGSHSDYQGTITDFWVSWDDDRSAYEFEYKQLMSDPDHQNWIAGFPSAAINTSMWFYQSYKPDYTLMESGSVEITDAKLSFSTADPVPEPATIALLGSGLLGLVISRKKFRTKRRKLHP